MYGPKLEYKKEVVNLETLVFMKVGSHGDEKFQEIIRRKKREEHLSGFMLWGYAGNLLDAFDLSLYLKTNWQRGKRIFIAMSETKSPFRNYPIRSKSFSIDKHIWYQLPKNVYTYGCDKAIICKGLEHVKIKIDLAAFSVSVGPSKGKNLSEYIKYRTDKACAEYCNYSKNIKPSFIDINWIAEIVAPFAVYLDNYLPVQASLASIETNSSELGVLSPNK